MSTKQLSEILLLGDTGLRRISEPIADVTDANFQGQRQRLQHTLDAFRAAYGFGRAISAPQIGISRRFIALRLKHGPELLINPLISWSSPETFTLWDDCMSFPFLMVKLRRHRSISIRYTDEAGHAQEWNNLEPSVSELLQHEMDHLDGVLAIDKAMDQGSIISRQFYEAHRKSLDSQVDYTIVPTT